MVDYETQTYLGREGMAVHHLLDYPSSSLLLSRSIFSNSLSSLHVWYSSELG